MTVADHAHPVIIYVPGLLPKPEPDLHKDALLRCLLASLERVDVSVADAIASTVGGFDIVSWTYDFYREHRDFAIDKDAIDAVISQAAASKQDIAEAGSWQRRLLRWIYRLGDRLPFLIQHFADERTELHLRDLRRYVGNDNDIAEHTRRMLKVSLRAATKGRHPILLVAHSMGSVISYDAVWEMSHDDHDDVSIDLLLTMGSPLGQRYLQKRIRGNSSHGAARYPHNIRHWKNLSAVGDMTAIDPWLANDFKEILKLGLVESFTDAEVHNYFRLDGVLNVHAEYGYLANDSTAQIIAAWWRDHDASMSGG